MPSYKVSEIDLIPKEWDAIFLSELFDFKNGLNKEKKFFGQGTPIINYMDVFCKSFINIDDIAGRVSVNSSELIAYGVQKGDVFFTRTSETIEEIGIASVMLDEPQSTVFSGFVLRARSKNMRLDDKFKAYCFAPAYFRKQIISHASYTTRALTNGRCLSETVLICPPLSEQITIGKALSDVDALLATLNKIIIKKHNMKQAVMKQLLTGKTRLPGFSRSWSENFVENFGQIVTGGTPSTSNQIFWGDGYPWITPTDISTERDIVKSERTITPKGLDAIRLLPANTLLVTCIASIGKNAILRTVGGCNQQINAIIPNDNYCVEFLYYLMEIKKEYLLSNAGTTATALLSKTGFSKMKFLVPDKSEQIAIGAILSDMDDQLLKLEERLNKTQELKQAMMQELLTGKTRLVNKELIDA
jgi:type I restriction enzyme S subunit